MRARPPEKMTKMTRKSKSKQHTFPLCFFFIFGWRQTLATLKMCVLCLLRADTTDTDLVLKRTVVCSMWYGENGEYSCGCGRCGWNTKCRIEARIEIENSCSCGCSQIEARMENSFGQIDSSGAHGAETVDYVRLCHIAQAIVFD